MVLASPRLLGKIGSEIFSKVTPKARSLLVLDHGQSPGETTPGLLCLPGAAVGAAAFPSRCIPCVLGVSLRKPWSWQVMEGQALRLPVPLFTRPYFFNELCKCLRVRTKSGPQAVPLPHLPDLVSPVGKCPEGCGGSLRAATSCFSSSQSRDYIADAFFFVCDLGPVTSLPVPHLHDGMHAMLSEASWHHYAALGSGWVPLRLWFLVITG